jgi:hypothetical protein
MAKAEQSLQSRRRKAQQFTQLNHFGISVSSLLKAAAMRMWQS